MPTTDTLYTARFALAAELLDHGRDNLLKCPVYRAGVLVSPTQGASSVLTVKAPDGTAVVDAAAVTVTNSVALYTVTSATLAAYTTPSEGWLVQWDLLMPDGTVHTFATQAMLVRHALYPVVTEADLYRRVSSLNPSGSAVIHSGTDFADKLDDAFIVLENMLIEAGNRPWLVITPGALREAHTLLTLAMIFEDFATRLNEAHEVAAARYRNQFEAAWSRVKLRYERSDGMPDTSSTRGAAGRGMIWTNVRG